MLRQVRGPGTLVPEDIRWITAATEATVERIVTLPSANILKPDTVILELRDETVQQALLDAELQLRGRRGRPRQPEGPPEQRAAAAAVATRPTSRRMYHKAKIQAEANEQLLEGRPASRPSSRGSRRSRPTELENRNQHRAGEA